MQIHILPYRTPEQVIFINTATSEKKDKWVMHIKDALRVIKNNKGSSLFIINPYATASAHMHYLDLGMSFRKNLGHGKEFHTF